MCSGMPPWVLCSKPKSENCANMALGRTPSRQPPPPFPPPRRFGESSRHNYTPSFFFTLPPCGRCGLQYSQTEGVHHAVLHHTFSLPSLLPGAGCMAVSCLSVLHLWSGINSIGHDRSRFPDGEIQAAGTFGCTFDSGAPQPRRGHIFCCARIAELMAESVYGGDIQSIVTDH